MCMLLLAVAGWSIWSNEQDHGEFDLDEALRVTADPGLITQVSSVASTVDPAAFDVTLWYTPPEPKRPEVRAPTPEPRFSLQLMAISGLRSDDGLSVRTAIIYDPEVDEAFRLRVGDQVGRFTVTQISDDSVELMQGNRRVVLELEGMEGKP